ncbi:MAG: multiple sugar transport system permease protein [Thermomicrobiales bacterium]|jgi:multiple sugar transport system permease protein|nr:multiple sugar transport system permease protein [Thermomicrobiales bacterium]MEA2528954.1 multiple sugar transport system permease protein [Thermomicrobiales bacterium]MEA2598459.1 multiple sugar transport system permease protein [Thermomicrobiales bacterium]
MSSTSIPAATPSRSGRRLLGRAKRAWREGTPSERAFLVVAYLGATAWAVVSLFPLYWMITTALKPPTSVMSLPPDWIPTSFSLNNFREAFAGSPVTRWTINSFVMAVSVTAFQLLFATMAGYGFAKKSFPGREILFWLYVSSMMIPGFALLIPQFTLMARLDLVNTYLGLIAPGLSAPFGVFLMRQFIQTLPSELIDAAKIDGCSELRVFWDIILPLAKPGLAVLGIFVFMGQWSAFLWPLIVASSSDMQTLMVGFALLANREMRVNYGALMAAGTYMAIPMLIVFFAFQRYFLRGITIGGIKG